MNVWFVGKDVAALLGYSDTKNAIKQHCKGKPTYRRIVDALGREQQVRVLSEPDMLRLVIGSHKPAAQRFEAWVFEEVLPSIRKGGGYISSSASPEQLKDLQAQITALEEKRKAQIENLDNFHQEQLALFKRSVNEAILYRSPKHGAVDEAVRFLTLAERKSRDHEIQNNLANLILDRLYHPDYPPERIEALLAARKKVADDRAKGSIKGLGGFLPWVPSSISDLEAYANEKH